MQNRFCELYIDDGVKISRANNAIALLVITSYLIQFFNRIIGSYLPYRILIIGAVILLISANMLLKITFRITIEKTWLFFVLIIFMNMLLHIVNVSYIMDLITYLICIIFVAYPTYNVKVFEKSLKVILFFSIVYSVSVFIQLILPSVYDVYLSLLPPETVYNINSLENTYGFTGFSTNPGFTAGHIASGIFVLFAIKISGVYFGKYKFRVYFLIMVIALLLTGKRGHLLALTFSCIVCYLICTHGKKRILLVNVILFGSCIMIPVLLVSTEFVSSIPVLARLSETLNGLLSGADISNGRNELSAYAIKLFLENPILGIGWGQFRTRVVGTITLMTELDVHNIYLQLLCETGVIGFMSFMIPVFMCIRRGISNLKRAMNIEKDNLHVKLICVYSLAYQLFFLLYGISGNPFFDFNYIIMYFVAITMTVVCSRKLKKLYGRLGVNNGNENWNYNISLCK